MNSKKGMLKKWFIPYFKKHRMTLALDLLCAFFTTGCELVLPMIVREITKIHEDVKRTTLFEAVKFYTENPPKGEFVLVIEGKSYEELSEEKAEEFENISVTEQINALIGEGIDKKDAIKQVAVLRNMKKRDVYNEYVKNTEGEF